jgi:hypothetical protein
MFAEFRVHSCDASKQDRRQNEKDDTASDSEAAHIFRPECAP